MRDIFYGSNFLILFTLVSFFTLQLVRCARDGDDILRESGGTTEYKVDVDGIGSSESQGDARRVPRNDTKRRERMISVDTPLGRVIGTHDQETVTFLGIPYAEPPLGAYRYRPPRQKEPWAPGAIKAFEFASECLQSSLYSGSSRPNSEDCLYLNVWTPKSASFRRTSNHDDLLPVMIWVYGGAFLHGGAGKPEYIGTQLAKRGVIVVSCNYRLGALGFLVSTVDGLYGNYGLADQKMAMMWVKQNIRSFGGDPERVTVFGESAGAMSLGLHIFDQYQRQQRQKRLGELETSLFQAAILQSNPFGYSFRSVAVANFLGTEFKERLDCEDVRCLQSESPDEIIHVQDTLMAVPRNIGDFFTWGPVVTDEHFWREFRLRPGHWANVNVRQPLQIMRSISLNMNELQSESQQKHTLSQVGMVDAQSFEEEEYHSRSNNAHQGLIPMIIGTTKDEGSVFVFTAFPTVMPKFIYQAVVVGFFRFAARRVLRQYSALSREQQLSPDPDYRLVLSVIIGDYLFKCPTQLFATLAQASNSSVYLYEFALPTRTPGYPYCDGLACHTSELPYVFNHLDIIREKYAYEDVNTAEEYWKEGGWESNTHVESSPKKKTFIDVAKGFFKDRGSTGELVKKQNEDDENRKYTPRPRHVIDANVSDHMANYWTTFARYQAPNGGSTGGSGGEGLNVVLEKDKAPLWVTITGLNRRKGIREGVTKENDSQHRIHLQHASELQRKMRIQADVVRRLFNHQLVFDEETTMHIIGDDCHCGFWNSLGYRF